MVHSADDDPLFSPLVERAVELAAQWHDGTYRKGTWRQPAFSVPDEEPVNVPVMAHLAAVASVVQRAGWPAPVVAAAYLHDAIEDRNRHGQRLRRAHLREAVGREVAELVLHVSEQKLDDDGSPRPWRARKEDYADHLPNAPDEAVAISLADKLHNLWSMTQSLEAGKDIFSPGPNRTALSAGPEEQLWFYRAVLDRTEDRGDERLTRMHDRLAHEIQRFQAQVREPSELGAESAS